jgi:hypothetical protein
MSRSLADLSALAERSRDRFEELTARIGARRRAAAPALTDDYWHSLRELFTRDLTADGLRDLLQLESQETFRFLTREVDLSDLENRPWHVRYPKSAWRFFLAVAYRLSPWRRVLFAIAVPLLVIGWLRMGVGMIDNGLVSVGPVFSWEAWLLLATTALFFLLTLELRDKLFLKGDLEVARQIQFGLLPFEPVERDRTSIVTAMRPANTVGGDYFDVVDLGEGRLAVAVGDVAGKGMPAALLMALLQGSLRTLIAAGFRGGTLLAVLNAHLCRSIPSNRLITFFYGELDTASGRLDYVNAGHNPPLVLRPGAPPEPLPATAVALAVMVDAVFPSESVSLAAGDRLLLYTDGVTEAANPAEEEYGEGRLRAFLQKHRAVPGRPLLDALVADVLGFCGGAGTRDDMTLMSLERR